MPNPINSTNTTVPIEVYNTLNKIREKHGWTFSEVLDKLCELEYQNNYVENTINYELYVNDQIFQFKVIFKKENMVFEYYDGLNYTQDISEWGIDNKTQKIFFEFIKEDCARCILLNMPLGLVFNTFDIYKLKD